MPTPNWTTTSAWHERALYLDPSDELVEFVGFSEVMTGNGPEPVAVFRRVDLVSTTPANYLSIYTGREYELFGHDAMMTPVTFGMNIDGEFIPDDALTWQERAGHRGGERCFVVRQPTP